MIAQLSNADGVLSNGRKYTWYQYFFGDKVCTPHGYAINFFHFSGYRIERTVLVRNPLKHSFHIYKCEKGMLLEDIFVKSSIKTGFKWDQLYCPINPNESCYKFARIKKYALRDTYYYDAGVQVGGMFLIPDRNNISKKGAIPIAPLIIEPDRTPWPEFPNHKILLHFPYFATPTLTKIFFSDFFTGFMPSFSPWKTWAKGIDVNENYDFSSDARSTKEKAIDDLLNIWEQNINIKTSLIPWEEDFKYNLTLPFELNFLPKIKLPPQLSFLKFPNSTQVTKALDRLSQLPYFERYIHNDITNSTFTSKNPEDDNSPGMKFVSKKDLKLNLANTNNSLTINNDKKILKNNSNYTIVKFKMVNK